MTSEPSTHHSICRFCHAACPILVEIADGVPLRVKGDPENPVYRGYSCARGRDLPRQHRHPERLLQSQKRDDAGDYHAISSERAMDEIAERVQAIVEEHGPRAVAIYIGTSSNQYVAAAAAGVGWLIANGSRMVFSAATIDQPGKHIANHGGQCLVREPGAPDGRCAQARSEVDRDRPAPHRGRAPCRPLPATATWRGPDAAGWDAPRDPARWALRSGVRRSKHPGFRSAVKDREPFRSRVRRRTRGCSRAGPDRSRATVCRGYPGGCRGRDRSKHEWPGHADRVFDPVSQYAVRLLASRGREAAQRRSLHAGRDRDRPGPAGPARLGLRRETPRAKPRQQRRRTPHRGAPRRDPARR
ncbi:MAG: hypothetical protein JRG94_17510 [Deltaproteobacteria bacterium]|nr:hypothetical protein [Deltaproteobacteria bacterium]